MMENLIVRPIEEKDLDDVYELSLEAKHGLSTLPKDKDLLEAKIQKSVSSFHSHIAKPGNELYLFV